MPQRVIDAWMAAAGLVGLVLVGALVLFGRDLRRAVRTGPAWKRRLLAAGLLLLGSIGLASCGPKAPDVTDRPAGSGSATAAPAGKTLAETEQWKRIRALWREVEECATGAHGLYSLLRADKQRLLASTDAFNADLASLETAGLLSRAEAGLLRCEFTELLWEIRGITPQEDRPSRHFEAKVLAGSWESAEPKFAALAGSERIDRIVARLAVNDLKSRIARLSVPGFYISREAHLEAHKIRDRVMKLDKAVRARPVREGQSIEKNPNWQAIKRIRKQVEKAFDRGLFADEHFAAKEAEYLHKSVRKARKKLAALHAQGAVTEAEKGYLAMRLDDLEGGIRDKQKREKEIWDGSDDGGGGLFADDVETDLDRDVLLNDLRLLATGRRCLAPLLPILDSVEERVKSRELGGLFDSDDEVKRRTKLIEAINTTRSLPGDEGSQLRASGQWRQFAAAWSRADQLVSFRRFADLEECQRTVQQFKRAKQHLAALERQGLLTGAEAKLLAFGHAVLLRSLGNVKLECVFFSGSVRCILRLKRWLPLLREAAGSPRRNWDVLNRVLPTVEMTLRSLEYLVDSRVERVWIGDFSMYFRPEWRAAPRLKAAVKEVYGPAMAAFDALYAGRTTQTALADTPEWRHLADTWRRAEAIATWRRGRYPYTEFGRHRLLADLHLCVRDALRLQRSNLLSGAEVRLLRMDLKTLEDGAQVPRSSESFGATCYDGNWSDFPTGNRQERIRKRLPLLEKLVGTERLRPEVMAKVLHTADLDLAREGSEFEDESDEPKRDRKKLTKKQKARREREKEQRKLAHELIRRIGYRLESQGTSLVEAADWQAIHAAWNLAGRLAVENGTAAERRVADAAIDTAVAAAMRLRAYDLLGSLERNLILREAYCLWENMHRLPPVDYPGEGYAPPHDFGYSNVAFGWVGPRAEWRKKAVRSRDVKAAVKKLMLAAIRADRAALNDPESLLRLAPDNGWLSGQSEEREQAMKDLDKVERMILKGRK